MDREKAVERCKNCKYCNTHAYYDGCMYMGCKKLDDKWIVEVEQCPKEEIEG